MAGPSVGPVAHRPAGEIKGQPKLVDARLGASADAGSIPAASIDPLFKPFSSRCQGNDLPALPRRGERVERRRELVVGPVSVVAHRCRQIRVSERLRCRLEAGGAAHLQGEAVAGPMQVEPGALALVDETRVLAHAVPPQCTLLPLIGRAGSASYTGVAPVFGCGGVRFSGYSTKSSGPGGRLTHSRSSSR